MEESLIKPSDIIDYWFSEKSKQFWFASTPAIDKDIKSRYESIWEQAASGNFNFWRETANGSVALIIILDQFPLNMFRSEAKSFKTESMAIEVALNAINNGFDEEMDNEKLAIQLCCSSTNFLDSKVLGVSLCCEKENANFIFIAQTFTLILVPSFIPQNSKKFAFNFQFFFS